MLEGTVDSRARFLTLSSSALLLACCGGEIDQGSSDGFAEATEGKVSSTTDETRTSVLGTRVEEVDGLVNIRGAHSGGSSAGGMAASGGDSSTTQGPGGDSSTRGATTACTNPEEIGGGFVRCGEGFTHRPSADSCPTVVPRAEAVGDAANCPSPNGTGCCVYDADCTGANQYCAKSDGLGRGTAYCTTGCVEDANCENGYICSCTDAPMGQCVKAKCETNAGCSGGLLCSSWVANNGCGPTTTFSCQTADDECAGVTDCKAGEECAMVEGIRRCQEPSGACSVGRPFIVAEEIRTASLCERSDWLSELELSVEGLSEDTRRALSHNWEKAAQMEHASIGAFARFSLQLLSLGAPVELIEATNQAMVDETRHARLCLGLASAYRGQSIGPSALDIEGALSDASLEAIVSTAIIEGCVGETVAALEAAECAAHCEISLVRGILDKIAADELRHAELAWRFVRWVIESHPELRTVVRSQFEALIGRAGPLMLKTEGKDLLSHGVLDDSGRTKVRTEALTKIVVPCVNQLFAQATQKTVAFMSSNEVHV